MTTHDIDTVDLDLSRRKLLAAAGITVAASLVRPAEADVGLRR